MDDLIDKPCTEGGDRHAAFLEDIDLDRKVRKCSNCGLESPIPDGQVEFYRSLIEKSKPQ